MKGETVINMLDNLIKNETLVEFIQNGQNEYLEQLYLQNKNMIYKIVRKCGVHSYSDIEDSMQNGYIGLYNAALSYNKNEGVKFSTYAYKAILNSVLKGVCIGNAIYMPNNIYYLWYKIQRERNRHINENESITAAELSKICNTTEEHINIITAAAMGTVSLNKHIDGLEGEQSELGELITDDTIDIVGDTEIKDLQSIVRRIISILPPMERRIIIYRYINGKTQSDTALHFHIPLNEVRNYECTAMRKLRSPKNKVLLADYI